MPGEKHAGGPGAGPRSPHASEEPPPYSAPGSSTATPRPASTAKVPGLPDLPFQQYTPATASVSSDGLTLTVPDPVLTSTPTALVAFLRAQAALPPLLVMRVQGTSYNKARTDFDVRLNLLRYLMQEPRDGTQEGANYVTLRKDQLPPEVQAKFAKKELTMLSLAQAFCSDRNTSKMITLTRTVTHLDESILTARVMQTLAELKYQGDVEVTFPIRNQRVRVTSSNSMLDKMVGFFSKARDYPAVESVWPFATAPPPAPEDHGGAHPARHFAVRSEEGLWHDWRPAFERAVLSDRQGWLCVEDLMEARMGLPGPKRKTYEWGSASHSDGWS